MKNYLKWFCLIPVIGSLISLFYLMYLLTFKQKEEIKNAIVFSVLIFFASLFIIPLFIASYCSKEIIWTITIILGLYGFNVHGFLYTRK